MVIGALSSRPGNRATYRPRNGSGLELSAAWRCAVGRCRTRSHASEARLSAGGMLRRRDRSRREQHPRELLDGEGGMPRRPKLSGYGGAGGCSLAGVRTAGLPRLLTEGRAPRNCRMPDTVRGPTGRRRSGRPGVARNRRMRAAPADGVRGRAFPAGGSAARNCRMRDMLRHPKDRGRLCPTPAARVAVMAPARPAKPADA